VLFVERQIAHAWAAGVCASIAMFVIEWQIGLPALTLSPGRGRCCRDGVRVPGWHSVRPLLRVGRRHFLAAYLMTLPALAGWKVLLFGVASALSFFIPGLKYYRQRRATTKRTMNDER